MEDFVFVSLALKLMMGLVALFAARMALRYLDKVLGISFADCLDVMKESATALAIYFGARFIAVGTVIAAVLGSLLIVAVLAAPSAQAVAFPDKYDRQIEKAVGMYWPGKPMELWKAQLWQESRLDPSAVSPVGAKGLAQFMPGTWREIRRALRYDASASAFTAGLAIEAGAYYMARLNRGWSAPRPAMDRHWLAASSYNAGMGNLIKAQRRCGGAARYADIIACLPDVTGRHSVETITYVERIGRWARMMGAGL